MPGRETSDLEIKKGTDVEQTIRAFREMPP